MVFMYTPGKPVGSSSLLTDGTNLHRWHLCTHPENQLGVVVCSQIEQIYTDGIYVHTRKTREGDSLLTDRTDLHRWYFCTHPENQ